MREPRGNLSDKRAFAQRKVDTKFVIKNIYKYLKPYLFLFVIVFIGQLFAVVLSLIGPKLSGQAIDLIKPDGTTDMNKVIYYCILLAGVYLASGVISYLSTIGMAYVARGMVKSMRNDAFDRLISLPVSYFDTRQGGYYLGAVLRCEYRR
jgi:ATP-binding cassette subfamily B protein